MGKTTGISWTDATWNPWQGCTKISQGCKNCYMYREKERYGQDPDVVVRSKPATFNAPLKWNLPERSRIFVCSWSDFFHEDADPWRDEAWDIIRQLQQYDFLIPTKRPERIAECLPADWRGGGYLWGNPLSNVWLGISAEDRETFNARLPFLMDIPATIHWVSAEPLLGPIIMEHYYQIDWMVIGGESGPGCRPMNPAWANGLVAFCRKNSIPVFVKQLGGWPNTRHELADFPEDLRMREFPK